MSVKRYDDVSELGAMVERRNGTGDWVRYSDVADLLTPEVAALVEAAVKFKAADEADIRGHRTNEPAQAPYWLSQLALAARACGKGEK